MILSRKYKNSYREAPGTAVFFTFMKKDRIDVNLAEKILTIDAKYKFSSRYLFFTGIRFAVTRTCQHY